MERLSIADRLTRVAMAVNLADASGASVEATGPALARLVTSPTFRIADTLAMLALLAAAIAAIAGLLVGGLYRDTAEAIRQARATDLVTLAAVVPALALGLWRARSGSAGGRLVTIGTLGYLSYSYAIYAFSVVINPVTPIHIAILGLSAWALLFTIVGIDDGTIDRAGRLRMSRPTTSGFLIVVAVLFASLWLGQIAGAITSGTLPAAVTELNLPTSSVYSLDLAFALPALVLAAGWLIRRDRRGPASAIAGLAFLVLLGLSVLSIFAFEGASGASIEAVPIVMFGLVTAIAAVILVRALSASPRTSS